MTRIIQGLVLATLISAAHAQQSPFPKNEGGDLKPLSTYADARGGSTNGTDTSAFPKNEGGDLKALSTYADAHAADANRQVGSAIPGDGKLESIGD